MSDVMQAADLAAMSDEDLVQRARLGSDEAFGELMRRNTNASKKLAASVLRDVTEAEDAMQDAWSKAWQHVANFHGESKFSTWFTRIVLNQCLMRIRSRRRRPTVQLEFAPAESERPAVQVADRQPDPETQLSREEIRALIRKEVAMLPPLLRDPIMLRDFEELPIEAVASRLEVSVPAAKSRLLRARMELRKRLVHRLGPSIDPSLAAG
jgi:RNA polymerase sigma-70 factor, ECF subfamily